MQIPNLKEVHNFEDLIKINDFVYKTVSHTIEPYPCTEETSDVLYQKFTSGQIGGWCGLNAHFLCKLLYDYGVTYEPFNYGFGGTNLTHIVVIASLPEGRYLLDPFFNKSYCDDNGSPIVFEDLVKRIEERRFNEIIPLYGASKKAQIMANLERTYWEADKFYDYILGGFYTEGLVAELEKNFQCDNPLLLITREITKLNVVEIKEFDRNALSAGIKSKPTTSEGWTPHWFGLSSPNKARSQAHAKAASDTHVTKIESIDETAFEDFSFLSILSEITKPDITFMELGAGWGAQSAKVSGVVNNQLVPMTPKNVECIAIEAEPFHYRWLDETFRYNSLNGFCLFGAMSNNIGLEKFEASAPSADSYGQALKTNGNITVTVYSVDYLMDTFGIEHIDILHMDVQGAEMDVTCGMMHAVENRKIDYLIIATHCTDYNAALMAKLNPYFHCIVSMRCKSGYHYVKGMSRLVHIPQDGFLIMKRKGF